MVNDLSHFGNYRQKYGTGRRNVSSMQITLFSRVLSVAFTYVVVRYSILRERFCGFRSSPAVRSYPLFCRARDVRKWYRACSETRVPRAKRRWYTLEIESCCSRGASSKTYALLAFIAHTARFWNGPRRIEDLPFYDPSIEVQRHCSYRCIILTETFNVMSGVKFESCESQGAWSHSEGH